MKVEAVMSRDVRTCSPEDDLATAAQLMWDADCGCVPIVEGGSRRVVGMLTDRDVCMATHFQGRRPDEIRVGDVMSTDVRTVVASEELADAEAIMSDAQVRRLPVVDGDERLVGMVSLADLARRADREREAERPEITEEEVGDTLTAICTPRPERPIAAPAGP
jgi:CBS domain-containing protein